MDTRSHLQRAEVDAHVGRQVRVARKALDMSQTALAERLGLTFQQIQKYERGFNRISASMLWSIGLILGRPPAYFFEGLADAPEDGRDAGARVLGGLAAEAAQLVPQITRIPAMDRATQKSLRVLLGGIGVVG